MSVKGIGTVRGFTLIEVMIAVVIVGILASIAYPSYRESVRKNNRAEAKVALTEGAQALERYYSINGRYTTGTSGTLALPAVFPTVVPSSGAARYNIAVQGAPTTNGYVLRATRTGSMAGDPCGDYQISSTGAQTLNGNTKSVAECW